MCIRDRHYNTCNRLQSPRFFEKTNELLNKHVPLKKMTKKELKLESKPWITPGIIASIKRRDNLLNKYIKSRVGPPKNKLHSDYKILHNRITGLIKRSKKNHYQKYFTQNSKDIKRNMVRYKKYHKYEIMRKKSDQLNVH